jgi:TPR repeat protein
MATIQSLLKLAKEGKASAQFALAVRLQTGDGVDKDLAQAASWFQKAAEQGHADAQYSFATCLEEGHVVDKDMDLADEFYLKAAHQGHIKAQHYAGYRHEMKGDNDQACMWYLRAANAGLAASQWNYSIQADLSKAEQVVWWRKAAEQGHVKAQSSLGFFLNESGNKREAAYWFRKAAKQGDAIAIINMRSCAGGEEYEKKDNVAAFHRAAVENDDPIAQYELGLCYERGHGVVKDVVQAAAWFRKASDQGDAHAQFALGLLLIGVKNDGVEKDYLLGHALIHKAADHGLSRAQWIRGAALIKGIIGYVPRDTRAGARYLGAAAQQGDEKALAALAEFADCCEVANECCGACGWGKSQMKLCTGCHVARFCSKECTTRMWPTHKPHCHRWAAEKKAES